MGTVGGQLLLLVGDPQVDLQTQQRFLVAVLKPIAVTVNTLYTNAKYAKSNDGLPTQA